jgi:hypothetical protein
VKAAPDFTDMPNVLVDGEPDVGMAIPFATTERLAPDDDGLLAVYGTPFIWICVIVASELPVF